MLLLTLGWLILVSMRGKHTYHPWTGSKSLPELGSLPAVSSGSTTREYDPRGKSQTEIERLVLVGSPQRKEDLPEPVTALYQGQTGSNSQYGLSEILPNCTQALS